LASTTYMEVMEWMKQEERLGHPVDILCLQETSWREDNEYVTGGDSPAARWFAVHSGSKEKAGILVLIRANLVQADLIRHTVLVAGISTPTATRNGVEGYVQVDLSGVVPREEFQQQDQAELQQLLRQADGRVLNSWSHQ
ncbi:unnamed protein product, partial [Symbiodinium necroappetens]